jgi:hypothetical protein
MRSSAATLHLHAGGWQYQFVGIGVNVQGRYPVIPRRRWHSLDIFSRLDPARRSFPTPRLGKNAIPSQPHLFSLGPYIKANTFRVDDQYGSQRMATTSLINAWLKLRGGASRGGAAEWKINSSLPACSLEERLSRSPHGGQFDFSPASPTSAFAMKTAPPTARLSSPRRILNRSQRPRSA